MVTKLTPIEELKAIYSEIFLNKTDEVTKITEGSVMNAHAFGVAKLQQKITKDVAIIESHIFPDSAYGEGLDFIARLSGVGQRFGQKQSTTYMLLVGAVGTTYVAGVNTFQSVDGITFDLVEDYTIGIFGYGYAKVRSTTTGKSTNVDAVTINKVNPIPNGHNYCINEYHATMGSDIESDDVFRKRIKEGINLLSRSTIAQMEQTFMKINENVFKVYYGGIDANGKVVLNVLAENGMDFTQSEFNDIVLRSSKFFSIVEFRPSNFSGYGMVLRNVDFQPIDISMRVDLEPAFNPDEVRKQIQIQLNKYLDYRYMKTGQKIEWDNLLQIVKSVDGVRYVNDYYFYPNIDIPVDVFKLPRIRGFRLMDLNGNIIFDIQNNLNPSFFPREADFSFITTALQNI